MIGDLPDDSVELYIRGEDSWIRAAGDDRQLVLDDWDISTTWPGGFEALTAELILPEGQPERRLRKFAQVELRGKSGTAWEGRLESNVVVTDERTAEVSAIGHQAVLEDNQNVVFLGVDNALDKWEEPPAKRIELQEAEDRSVNTKFTLAQGWGSDDDEDSEEEQHEGFSLKMEAKTNVASSDAGEAWYPVPKGEAIDEVQWIGSRTQNSRMQINVRAREWIRAAGQTASVDATDLFDLQLQSWEPGITECRYIFLRDSPVTGKKVNKTARYITVHAVSVFGDHGLPRHEIDDAPDGLLWSDVIRHLAREFTPTLRLGRIVPSSYPAPHINIEDPITMAEVLEQAIALEPNREWAVWEEKTLVFGPRRGTGRTWRLRRADGARWVRAGETAEPDYNGVVVSFTAPSGRNKRVGPPGSGADVEDGRLADRGGGNPVNAAEGMGDRTLFVEAGETNLRTAVETGIVALREATRGKWTGEVEVPRWAETTDGERLPSWLMRGGDLVLDGDSDDPEPRLLVGTSYQRSGERPLTGTIDRPANRLESELARGEAAPAAVKPKRIRREKRKLRRELRKAERKKKGGSK